MANNDVKIIVSAVDKASAELQKVNKSLGGASGMSSLVTAASTAWMAFSPIIEKGVDAVKAMVNETVKYNKTIREMSQVTGLGSEEISRIVQVGDDWGISIEAIRTSLAFMNKTGLSPSIENLAKLADEYVNTTDKAAFAEKAVKVLGRGYQTLIPLLALGGDGFRAAAAGIDKSLIATEDAIKKSREYEVAMDNLNDSVTGLKYNLGNQLLPTLVKVTSALNEAVSMDNRFTEAMNEANEAGDKAYKLDINRARSITDVTEAQIALNNAYTLYLVRMGLIVEKGERDVIPTTEGMTEAQLLYNDAVETYSQRSPLYLQQYADFTQAQKDAKFAIDEADASLDIINGTIKDYGSTLVEHMKIEAAFKLALGLITPEIYNQTIAIANSLIPLEAMAKLVSENALDVSYLTQAISDGKVTREELISAFIATGMAARDAAAYVDTLLGKINAIPTRKRIDIDVVYNEGQMPPTPGGPPIPKASGGPVYSGIPYVVGEEGPELFVPNGSGKIINNRNFTMNIHTNAKTGSLVGNYNMMKAMAK